MTKPLREFIDPETGKPMDREWLDYELEKYINTSPMVFAKEGSPRPPRSDREIYDHFAPVEGGWKWFSTRTSWQKKPRKVRRQMIAASLCRLISIGKIRIADTLHSNPKSMHGLERRQMERDKRLFGKEHDGVSRFYSAGSVLDALVEAMGEL